MLPVIHAQPFDKSLFFALQLLIASLVSRKLTLDPAFDCGTVQRIHDITSDVGIKTAELENIGLGCFAVI